MPEQSGTQTAQPQPKPQHKPFVLNLIEPYGTHKEGQPMYIPFVIDGLLTQGGFSILGAQPKLGKSSLSRYEAVRIAKGLPFLGRTTTQGDVLLISLEDPINHVDNCLLALDWNPKTDARIQIVDKLPPSINDSLEAIGDVLQKMPDVRLVVVDTLPKLLRCSDVNDYSKVMDKVELVHDLARKFPHLHVQGIGHCKKVKTDNPFESLLGSTALRGETDTTIILYEDSSHRVAVAEARQGRSIDPTILNAEMVEIAGSNVVKTFSLGQPLSEWQAQTTAKKEKKQTVTSEQRVIDFLMNQSGFSAYRVMTLDNIGGNRANNIKAVETLVELGVLKVTGTKQSGTDPLVLHLDRNALQLHNFTSTFGGSIQ